MFFPPGGIFVASTDRRTKIFKIHYVSSVLLSVEKRLDLAGEDEHVQLSFTNMAGDLVHNLRWSHRDELPPDLWSELAHQVDAPQAALRLMLPDDRVIAKGDS